MGALMFIAMMVSLIFVTAELIPVILIASGLYLMAAAIESLASAIRNKK